MNYEQKIDRVFQDGVLNEAEVVPLFAEAEQCLQTMLAEEFELFAAIENPERHLQEAKNFYEQIEGEFHQLVVLGTGGSSLCGEVLAGFKRNKFCKKTLEVVFMANVDPRAWDDFFNKIDYEKTAFLVISKSGESIEPMAQLMACLNKYGEKGLPISKHFYALTMAGDNSLRQVAADHGMQVYEHSAEISGRYSVFSNVAFLPAIAQGFDIEKYLAGAAEFFAKHAESASKAAALHVALMRKNIWQNVFMTYPDNLVFLNNWYRQIWAESLGKNGTGSTPVRATGTVDQHSQLQMYLGGRKDKFYNIVTLDCAGEGKKFGENPYADLQYLNGKTLGDLIVAEQRSTIKTLAKNGRPVRSILLGDLSEFELGILVAHLATETIVTAKLLGVNPFDQPHVEQGKVFTKEFLAR